MQKGVTIMSNERIYKIKRVGEYKVIYVIREYTKALNNWELKGKLIFNYANVE